MAIALWETLSLRKDPQSRHVYAQCHVQYPLSCQKAEVSKADYRYYFSTSVRVHLWDLSGSPEYIDVRNELYGQTDAVFLVFDVTNQASFESLDTWIKEINKYSGGIQEIVLVANKVRYHYTEGPFFLCFFHAFSPFSFSTFVL